MGVNPKPALIKDGALHDAGPTSSWSFMSVRGEFVIAYVFSYVALDIDQY